MGHSSVVGEVIRSLDNNACGLSDQILVCED